MKNLDDFFTENTEKKAEKKDLKTGIAKVVEGSKADENEREKTSEVPQAASFKFAHMADCHLGAFREKELRKLNLEAFERSLEACIERRVDFIVISGDLFHSASPDMEIADRAVMIMKKVVDHGIKIYIVYGSHDCSANTKSLIDLLNTAGLFKKVVIIQAEEGFALETVVDGKTGVEIAGMSGRVGGLEREYYENLRVDTKTENFKIFMFHSAIREMRPSYIPEEQSMSASLLPEGFDYYAGGHVHERMANTIDDKKIVFPGPLFGSNVRDLKKMEEEKRGFYVVSVVNGSEKKSEFVEIKVADVCTIDCDFDGMDSKEANAILEKKCDKNVIDKIVVLQAQGELKSGSVADINIVKAKEKLVEGGAKLVVPNTFGLTTSEKRAVAVEGSTKEEIEEKMFKEFFEGESPGAREFFRDLSINVEDSGMTRDNFEDYVSKKGYQFFGVEEG